MASAPETATAARHARRPADDSLHPVVGIGTFSVSARAKALVLEALESGRLSYGPFSQRFEQEFARLHGCRFGVLSNSGTSALQLALQTLKEEHGWQDGDEVIVPAVTFVATVNVVLHNRMVPVLVDVDPVYYELDPALLEERIGPRTRAVIPVHLFGQPCDMDPIAEIARRHGLKLIEDSCQSMFARYAGRAVGSLSDIGCFSTYVAHLLVTGVGGLNTTNDPAYAVRLRSLANHGRDAIYLSIDDDDGRTAEELRIIAARRFRFVSVGHSFRCTEMEAALGLAQLEEWEPMIAARRANAKALTAKLKNLEDRLQLPAQRPGSDHSFMMYPLVLRDAPKAELVNFLERNGVETREMMPLTNQPVYRERLGWSEEAHPVARWLNASGFYVGCHQDLGELELDYVVELIERFFHRQHASAKRGTCLVLTAAREPALRRALEILPRELFDRVVAADRNLDPGTRELLRREEIEVVSTSGLDPVAAVASGALPVAEDALVFFAADGSHDPRDVGRLMLALERGNDMVVASRFVVGGQRRPSLGTERYSSIGNRSFALLANLFFEGNQSDPLTGFRAIRRSRLQEIALRGRGLSLAYRLSIRSMKGGWRVAEVPTVELLSRVRYGRAAASIVPILAVLVRELLSGRRSRRAGA